MIRVPDIGEIANDGLSIAESKPVKIQRFDILRSHSAILWMHCAAFGSGRPRRILLKFRVHPRSHRIHNAWNALSTVIEVFRVGKSQRMSILVSRRGGAFVQVFKLEIAGIASQPVHKGNIPRRVFLNADEIAAGIGIGDKINDGKPGFKRRRDAESQTKGTALALYRDSRFIPHRFNFRTDQFREIFTGSVAIGYDMGMYDNAVFPDLCFAHYFEK